MAEPFLAETDLKNQLEADTWQGKIQLKWF